MKKEHYQLSLVLIYICISIYVYNYLFQLGFDCTIITGVFNSVSFIFIFDPTKNI